MIQKGRKRTKDKVDSFLRQACSRAREGLYDQCQWGVPGSHVGLLDRDHCSCSHEDTELQDRENVKELDLLCIL